MQIDLNSFNDRSFLANQLFTFDVVGVSIERLPSQMSISHASLCSNSGISDFIIASNIDPETVFGQFAVDAYLHGETAICWSEDGFQFWPPNWKDKRIHAQLYTSLFKDITYKNKFKVKSYLVNPVDQQGRGIGIVTPNLPDFLKTNAAWNHDFSLLQAFAKNGWAQPFRFSYGTQHQSFAQSLGLIYEDDPYRFHPDVIKSLEAKTNAVYSIFLKDCEAIIKGLSFSEV